MKQGLPTKLVVAIIQIDDVHDLTRELIAAGFGTTRIDAAGGFLRRDNAIVLVATTDDRLDLAIGLLRKTCQTRTVTWVPSIDDGLVGVHGDPLDVEVGGAVVFIFPIERVIHLVEGRGTGRLSGATNRGGDE